MTAGIIVAGVALAVSIMWLLVSSTGLSRPSPGHTPVEPSWRTAWPAVLATALSAASFLILRFLSVEAPVASAVVVRGWLGLFAVFGFVAAGCSAVMMAAARYARRGGATQ